MGDTYNDNKGAFGAGGNFQGADFSGATINVNQSEGRQTVSHKTQIHQGAGLQEAVSALGELQGLLSSIEEQKQAALKIDLEETEQTLELLLNAPESDQKAFAEKGLSSLDRFISKAKEIPGFLEKTGKAMDNLIKIGKFLAKAAGVLWTGTFF
ncbi:hypothetical protein Dalk_0603 [Desulfatibacillum aliphaticivorans]|uniref:Uncharacterized protein n=1 Tax=Desulfatibacillum aliphaticivorans TaxID=218208 RepID=B8FHM0_DESAL|nr:hypothetical protein [Desulfatibacillum aliphaticivorans]ACL02308.1 hypothetical protein Dalk_0603 [Desulfatibacillum aliphaticivorans]